MQTYILETSEISTYFNILKSCISHIIGFYLGKKFTEFIKEKKS